MGAALDSATVGGKSAALAFNQLVQDRQYSDGHGGYSGTFAEKHDFTKISVPVNPANGRRMQVKKFLALVSDYADAFNVWDEEVDYYGRPIPAKTLEEKIADIKKQYAGRKWTATRNQEIKWAKEEHRRQQKVLRSIPDWALANVKAAAAIGHGDKWGPALCVELLGAEKSAAKKALGLNGKQGIRIYHFLGYCSS